MARSNINICIFSGNLTRDPEINISGAGNVYARFTIASNDEVYDVAAGGYIIITNFIDFIAFSDIADQLKHCQKGQKITVESKLVQHVMYDEKCGRNRRYSIYRATSIDVENTAQREIPERGDWSASGWIP